jgi:hypothetical protein
MSDDDEAVSVTVDQVADHLYGLAPEEFVAARDRSARAMRADGDTTAAKAVKGFRRPTVAAWAVNRLVREQPEMLDELLAVTIELEQAQREALAGEKVEIREVSERRQQILDELVRRAEAIIGAVGRSSSGQVDDIARTLQASSDPDLAQELRRGRLVTALQPTSTLASLTSWFEQSGAKTSASERERRRELEQARRAADEELVRAERDVRDAGAEVTRLQAELRAAERRLDKAEQQRQTRRAASERSRGDLDETTSGGS